MRWQYRARPLHRCARNRRDGIIFRRSALNHNYAPIVAYHFAFPYKIVLKGVKRSCSTHSRVRRAIICWREGRCDILMMPASALQGLARQACEASRLNFVTNLIYRHHQALFQFILNKMLTAPSIHQATYCHRGSRDVRSITEAYRSLTGIALWYDNMSGYSNRTSLRPSSQATIAICNQLASGTPLE